MALKAKAEPNANLTIGNHSFEFGSDGTRKVTAAEAEIIRGYVANGGTSIEIIEDKKGGK